MVPGTILCFALRTPRRTVFLFRCALTTSPVLGRVRVRVLTTRIQGDEVQAASAVTQYFTHHMPSSQQPAVRTFATYLKGSAFFFLPCLPGTRLSGRGGVGRGRQDPPAITTL